MSSIKERNKCPPKALDKLHTLSSGSFKTGSEKKAQLNSFLALKHRVKEIGRSWCLTTWASGKNRTSIKQRGKMWRTRKGRLFENNSTTLPNKELKFVLHHPIGPYLCSLPVFNLFMGHE